MVLQPESLFKDELTCPICYNVFCDPQLLPCGHTFCKGCLLTMFRNILEGSFQCPVCRFSYISIVRLQKNFALADVVDAYMKAQREKRESDQSERSRTADKEQIPQFICTKRAVCGILLFLAALYFSFDQCEIFPGRLHSKLSKQQTLLYQIYSVLLSNDALALDASSASPFLKVSGDLTSVERQKDRLPVVPHPYRFDQSPQVLAAQCFSEGVRHWVVEAKGYWDIAITYSSINRKNRTQSTFGMGLESWSLTQNRKKELFAFHNGVKRQLYNKSMSQSKVAVTVVYQDGIINFWDIGDMRRPLYSFRATFTQPVCLGFGLYQANPPTRISIVPTLEQL